MHADTGGIISHDEHPDVHVINRDLAANSSIAQIRNRKRLNIPVDVLREYMLGGKTGDGNHHEGLAYHTPLMKHGKVFIIDEAETIDAAGQNALLKTLEEPPAGTYIILVSARSEHLLPTIRSRCRRLAFSRLLDADVDAWLRKNPHMTDADRQRLVTFADGSLGQVELAMQYDLDSWVEPVSLGVDQLAAGRYPPMLGGDMAAMINGFAVAWTEANKNSSKEGANRHGTQLMLGLIGRLLRQRLASQVERVDGQPIEQADAMVEPINAAIDAVAEAERLQAGHVNMSLVTDHLVSRMHHALQAAVR